MESKQSHSTKYGKERERWKRDHKSWTKRCGSGGCGSGSDNGIKRGQKTYKRCESAKVRTYEDA
jgi:hypothetical protein